MVLSLLLLGDVLLIAVFLSHRLLGWPTSHYFNIGIDRSIPEYFQYFKELSLSVVLLAMFLRERSTTALLWSLLAAMLLLDDAFQVHEEFGSMIDGVFAALATEPEHFRHEWQTLEFAILVKRSENFFFRAYFDQIPCSKSRHERCHVVHQPAAQRIKRWSRY